MRFDWLRNSDSGAVRRNAARAGLCLAVVAAVACEAGSEEPGEGPEATGFTAEAPGVPESLADVTDADSLPEPGSFALRAELEARGGTDVIGTVSLTPGAGGTTVAVEIHGANSGLPYVAEIVAGSCASAGPVIAQLGEITAGEEGDGDFQRVVDRALLGPDRPDRAVRVRGAGDAAAIVACGDLGPGATSGTGR
ncbi:MAG TPA: hypothetical protein VJ982_06285 [Gemmatimonadota bacterium]|nr:hypothetical protein [Gemmatimonadota bacterium]